MEEAVSERRKVYAAAHRSDEYRQAYISASRHALSDIAKAKAKAWQATCSSLSSKSNPKSVSLLRSVVGSSSSSSSYLTFPNCSSRESTSVFADNLRSHFSIFQPKASRSIARGYLFELRRATCPKEYHSSLHYLFLDRISRGCYKPLLVHCHWPRQTCLSHVKAPSSLWHKFSPTIQEALFRLERWSEY